MMQHEGAALIVYRIPADDEAPFVNVFLPNGVSWVERRGWLLGDLGRFHVGVRPIGAYAWERIRESRNDAIMVVEGDLIDGWMLRIHDLDAGLAIEAVEADDVTSFESFCERRSATDVDLSAWPKVGRVGLTTLSGRKLSLEYDGTHSVDGVAIDYASWPLYEAPGVSAALNTGKVSFSRGGERLEVDFGVDPETPLPPMRVIG
jgi:hypothetical protein